MLTNEIIRLQAEAQQDYVKKPVCLMKKPVIPVGSQFLTQGSQDHVLRSGQILMRFWYRRSQITLQVLVL